MREQVTAVVAIHCDMAADEPFDKQRTAAIAAVDAACEGVDAIAAWTLFGVLPEAAVQSFGASEDAARMAKLIELARVYAIYVDGEMVNLGDAFERLVSRNAMLEAERSRDKHTLTVIAECMEENASDWASTTPEIDEVLACMKATAVRALHALGESYSPGPGGR